MVNTCKSLDDMWRDIEDFGFERELLDPRNDLAYKNVQDLHLAIKNHESSTEENREKNQQKLQS